MSLHRACIAGTLRESFFSSRLSLGGAAGSSGPEIQEATPTARPQVLPMMLVAEQGGLGLGVGEVGAVFACMSAVNVVGSQPLASLSDRVGKVRAGGGCVCLPGD